MRDLEGRVALVTGGSRGIGRAISLELARRGSNVIVAYLRNRKAAEETAARIEDEGVKAVPIKAHVGDEDQLARLFGQIDEIFGSLDIFVSNAATGVIKPVAELDARAWAWTMDSNARAFLLGARSALSLMSKGGSMVALTSIGSSRVLPGYAAVGASKAALESLVRYLAVELAPQIRVNAISPGVVDTEALTHFPMREEMLSRALGSTPAGRLVTPDDVARSAGFLISESASMITGQVLTIDGGSSLLA